MSGAALFETQFNVRPSPGPHDHGIMTWTTESESAWPAWSWHRGTWFTLQRWLPQRLLGSPRRRRPKVTATCGHSIHALYYERRIWGTECTLFEETPTNEHTIWRVYDGWVLSSWQRLMNAHLVKLENMLGLKVIVTRRLSFLKLSICCLVLIIFLVSNHVHLLI